MENDSIPEGQGSEVSLGGIGGASTGARGRTGVNADVSEINKIANAFDSAGRAIDRFTQKWSRMSSSMKVAFAVGGGTASGGGGGPSRTSVPIAGTADSPATVATGGAASSVTGSVTGGVTGRTAAIPPPTSASGDPNQPSAVRRYGSALNTAVNQGIGARAEYSLQADRMSVQLQQMYGMSNSQVRNQLRMPLTGHYLLGGGAAVNDLLALQANTGLSAGGQASSVEAIRAISGFSYGSSDVTRMLSTMASPDVANRMFMMGGTGMYGIGGTQQGGMKVIQDIVRRTGLTNPEALKGALQQGSNTRQRLTAMGVPQDMQDLVIQYAMQNTEYQKKSGGSGSVMYDPSLEPHRETMGIEGSYIVQHEKTTGERIKREEKFFGRQVDNFADFEKNLRTATKALTFFEEQLSTMLGMKISTAGHPITNFVKSLIPGGDPIDGVRGGDPVDGLTGSPRPPVRTPGGGQGGVSPLPEETEKKLAQLKPALAVPLRRMLSERPDIRIHDTIRTEQQQEAEFRNRYRPTDKPEKTDETDRKWNGVIWEMKPEAKRANKAALAPPGQSMHQIGLAADINQSINPEHKEWVLRNASRFGLVTGYTGRGGPGDEWFHLEPQSESGLPGGARRGRNARTASPSEPSGRSSTSGARSVPTSAVRNRSSRPSSASVRSFSSSTRGSSSGMSANVSSLVSTLTEQGNALYQRMSSQPQVASTYSMGGDPIDDAVSSMGGGGGGISITVSPNIYLTGGSDMSTDIKRIAREVGQLLENEVRLKMLRRT